MIPSAMSSGSIAINPAGQYCRLEVQAAHCCADLDLMPDHLAEELVPHGLPIAPDQPGLPKAARPLTGGACPHTSVPTGFSQGHQAPSIGTC